MCDQVARPLLDRGAGGRSPGFLQVAEGGLGGGFNKLEGGRQWHSRHGANSSRNLLSSADLLRSALLPAPKPRSRAASPAKTSLATTECRRSSHIRRAVEAS